jgi:hypothetical protein
MKYWAIMDQYSYLYEFEIYIGRKERKKGKKRVQIDLATIIKSLVS